VINLAFEDNGSGDPVLFIAGTGGAGRTWHIYQVPSFVAAGYRCITFDNRGIGATENAGGFGTEQMVADTAALIEEVIGGPTRVVAMSMGAYIAQELMLTRPSLVSQAVLMGTRGRIDRTRRSFSAAEVELNKAEIQLPPAYAAKVRVLENFSPKTINDDKAIGDWMEMFTAFPIKRTPGLHAQLEVYPHENRLTAYRSITTEVLVIGFADDLLTPAEHGREVADALPNGRYIQIGHAGHLGFLEHPETVNTAMLDFFAGTLV
jgi:pimeloyl-ACP methyl ester carboxylesterase